MKKTILIFLQIFFLLLVSESSFSQTGQPAPTPSVPILTPNGIFDLVSDRYGNQYSLANLSIANARPISGVNTISSIAGTCTAGYFKLYFESGSIFDTNPLAQTLICKVYTDVSNFINSNAPAGSINIHCRNSSFINNLGGASSFFVYPLVTFSNNNGLLDGQVYKAIVSGTDPYLNLPISFVGSSGFYHGFVEANDSATWNFTPTITAIASNEYDFYTVMLHEAMHTLGIVSLMKYDGFPYFGLSNYYSRYDKFLCDFNGNPLLASTSTLCPASTYSFAPASASVIGTSIQTQTGSVSDISTCSVAAKYIGSTTLTVYTPAQFELGSSLMHFEDMCTHPSFTTACTGTVANWNNMYFAMANFASPGSCQVKRYLKDEEKMVLCDLGYSVNATFGSTAVAGSSYTYSSGQCSPTLTIYGNNDGIASNVYTYSTTTSSTVIPFSSILSNDLPTSGLDVSCLEVLSNNATITVGGSNVTVNAGIGAGAVLLKYYPKHISSGTFGNATYITVYFVPPGCISCNIINNGGFEYSQTVGTNQPCGTLFSGRWLDCWEHYQSLSELWSTSCPNSSSWLLSTPTQTNSPSIYPLNTPSVNNQCVRLVYGSNVVTPGAIKNKLNTPLVNGLSYAVSFWVINLSPGSSSTISVINPSANPIVVTLASHSVYAFTPTGNFPAGLNIIQQSTVNAGPGWTHITYTFVYTPTVSAQSIIIGLDAVQTVPPGTVNPGAFYYNCFLDELSINPISSPSIAIPTSTLCTNQSVTNLALYTGTTPGVFSGTGISLINGQYNFNLTGTLSPGSYPIAFTYTNGGCLNTIYHSITIENCCSTSTVPTYTGTNVSGGSVVFNGPKRFPNSFTVQPGTQLALSGEFLIDPGVKITVSSTATLLLLGSHLYGCVGLWEGIEVLSGGQVQSLAYGGNENLIEDAEIAMNVSNYSPNIMNNILDLKDIIFNKNYISINLTNYTLTSNTYSTPLNLSNCVFTCRNFTYNSTSWPHASTSDLRSATNTTAGLVSPYGLQGAPLTTLKSPHISSPSHIAINIVNCGTNGTIAPTPNIYTFNPVYVGPSSGVTPASNFILFDAHETFISANSSNVKVENCVFQNTQTLVVNNTATAGAAIQFTCGTEKTMLEVTGVNQSLGCRFWNCHTAIDLEDAYNLKIENAIIRSSHNNLTSSSPTLNLHGDRGIYINTNRFEDYLIQNNEFSNVSDALAIVCTPRPFVGGIGWFEPFIYMGNTYYWIIVYAREMNIVNNTFSPELNTAFTGTTTNYMNNAITVTGPLNIWSTWGGIKVENNFIYRAYNGIAINGLNSIGLTNHVDGPPKIIRTNTITLDQNFVPTVQSGIEFANSIPAPTGVFPTYTSQALQTIENNVLAVFNAPLTNTNIALIHCFGNGGVSPTATVVPAPYVICNVLSDAYKGFWFEGPNQLTYWRGNNMTNLGMGMALTNSAIIGAQGSAMSASDNLWLGSWTSYTNTYVDGVSDAAYSPLYVQNTSTTYPTTNSGPAPLQSYNSGTNISVVSTGASTYVCGGGYFQSVAPLPPISNPGTDALSYIAKMQAYRYLYYAPAIRGDAGSETADFYDGLIGTSIDVFTQIEDTLSRGHYDKAHQLLATLDQNNFNTVELNYYSFYDLYLKYADPADPAFTSNDLDALEELASLCPGTNGAAIYQARALYLMITGRVFNPPSPCEQIGGERLSNTTAQGTKNDKKLWSIEFYPNPATNQISVLSSVENEKLEIIIRDVTGRLVMQQNVKISAFITNLDLGLINGVYFITVNNQNHETVTKKLLISK